MSYKNYLQERIKNLKEKIDNNQGEVESIKKELQRLEMASFEEDMANESTQQLLKG